MDERFNNFIVHISLPSQFSHHMITLYEIQVPSVFNVSEQTTGDAQPGRLGHARKTVLHGRRDSCVGDSVFRTSKDGARRRTAQLHATAAEDLERCGHAHYRTAMLL